MSAEKVVAHFRTQAGFCHVLGSPFTAELVDRCADDLEAGGPVATLVADWPGRPRADAPALRLAGALHCAALSGRAPALAAEYPAARADWSLERVWPLAHAFLARERAWVAAFLASAPQTNEVRRAIALLAGFLAFAERHPGPIDTLEIGASAGLNALWDRFAYRTDAWSWGAASPVVIDTEWHGAPPPVDAPLSVRRRAACDLNPLDVRDASERLRLRSYVWADQPERLARFDGAVALALRDGVRVERAGAVDWLRARLAARAADAPTVVYHSVFLQYPSRAERRAIAEAIAAAGAAATRDAPLGWVRLEPEAVIGGPVDSARFLVDVIDWPGGERRVLAATDGHVRRVEALADAPAPGPGA